MGKKIFYVMAIGLLLLLGCVQQKPVLEEPLEPTNSCGNGICEVNEDCENCAIDCGCKENEYCEEASKVCKTMVCGNGIIEPGETSENCCSDVGCEDGLICNKVNQQCMPKSTIAESKVEQTANDYISEGNLDASIEKITDAYYSEEIVKQVKIKCNVEEDIPCEIILYIDEDGNILEEIHTT